MTVGVFVATLVLILWKPRGIHEAAYAVAGAGLLFAAGLLDADDIGYIWGFVWNATFSLIGVMLLASLLDQNGFFRWAALHIVARFHHRQWPMMIGLSLLAACITVFFNNDGTILMMIPIVLEVTALLKLSRKGKLAFLLAVGFMADTASAPLMMSNLTNILMSDFFGISFDRYARTMLVPGATAIAVTIGAASVLFGRSIAAEENREEAPAHFPDPASAIGNRRLFRFSWLVIGSMMTGYMFSEQLHVPVAAIALGGAALQWAASAAAGRANARRTLLEAPWLIVLFALAMNLIVYALHIHGAVSWFPDLLKPAVADGQLTGIFGSGILFSLLAATVNNLPAVLVSSLAIEQVNGPAYLPYAGIIGAAIGAKLTPIGSLATLLWLQQLRKGGIRMTWREYMKYGLMMTVPILFCALAALWLIVGK